MVKTDTQDPRECKHAIEIRPFGIGWHICKLTAKESQCKVEKRGCRCSKFTPKTPHNCTHYGADGGCHKHSQKHGNIHVSMCCKVECGDPCGDYETKTISDEANL